MTGCSISGCTREHLARGWCNAHYQRWERHGDPEGGNKQRLYGTPEERFWASIKREHGCWKWQESINDSGYGIIAIGGKRVRAHRFAWSLIVGEIPRGLQIDHRCRHRDCVNPEHLRLATNKQNAEHVSTYSNNTSGYRGVTFNKRLNKWSVLVMHCGRNHFGGNYSDVHEAAAAAKALRNELFTHNDLDRITS